jgi:hypothetical protein
LFERLEAIRAVEKDQPDRAIAAYEEFIREQPMHAHAHYRLARLLELAGSYQAANNHYILARDHDGVPLRCIAPLEAAFRTVAGRYAQSVVLVDGPAVLRAKSRHGILDHDLFHDNVHPSLVGHVALAQAVLGGLKSRGAFGWPPSTPAPVLDPGRVAEDFGIDSDAWATVCERAAAAYGLLVFVSADPAERMRLRDRYAAAASQIRAGARPDGTSIPAVGTGHDHADTTP